MGLAHRRRQVTGQVILPTGALPALLTGSAAGDACLRLLGIEASDSARATAALLDSGPGATDDVTRVLTEARDAIAGCDRCVVLTAESGALRAGWVFVGGDRGAELAISPVGLHVSATRGDETRTVLQTWLSTADAAGVHAYLVGADGVQQALMVGEQDGSAIPVL